MHRSTIAFLKNLFIYFISVFWGFLFYFFISFFSLKSPIFHRYIPRVTPRSRFAPCFFFFLFCFKAVAENNRFKAPTLLRSARTFKHGGRWFCWDTREPYCTNLTVILDYLYFAVNFIYVAELNIIFIDINGVFIL